MPDIKPRKGFETGGTITNAKEWETLEYYWMDKTVQERLEGLWLMVQMQLITNGMSDRLDKTVAGDRLKDNF
jgi:hypothetical protein